MFHRGEEVKEAGALAAMLTVFRLRCHASVLPFPLLCRGDQLVSWHVGPAPSLLGLNSLKYNLRPHYWV